MPESCPLAARQLAFKAVSQHTLALVFAVVFILLLCQIVYNLYFHPLAKYPGLRLAAASLGYEIYYDAVRHEQYIWKIREMHKKYGQFDLSQAAGLCC